MSPVVTSGALFIPTYNASGATAANVMALVSIGGDFDQASVDGIAASWEDNMKQSLNANWFLDSSHRFVDLSVDPPDELFGASAGDNGSIPGGALPPASACVLSLVAGGGRRRKGRIYFPGQSESQWSDIGTDIANYGTGLSGHFVDYATDIATGFGWLPAVYSRVDGVVRAVQSFGVDDVLDTQRRRQQRIAG